MKNSLILIFLAISTIAFATPDHLIFTEIVITPSESEYIKIKNPTSSDIDLSNYYLSDAVDTSLGAFYYNLPSGTNYHSGSGSDFTVRFPDGYILGAGQTIIIAARDDYYFNTYGDSADLVIKTDFRMALDGVPTVGGAPSYLDNTQESLVLFYWDGSSSVLQDVDYFVWGSRLNCVDKTGVSGYHNDTPVSEQQFLAAHVDGEKFQRIGDEGTEADSNGNGITGHDETSEPFTETWQIVTIANTKPQLGLPYYSPESPTTENTITFFCNVSDDSDIDSVILYYKTDDDWVSLEMTGNEGLYQVTAGPFEFAGAVFYYVRAVDDTGLENSTNIYQITVFEPQPVLTVRYIREHWDEYAGQTVTLNGVVTIGSNILRTDFTSAYFQDISGRGFNLYSGSVTDLQKGDSIEVTGTLEEFNGTYELSDFTAQVLAINVPIPAVDTVDIENLVNYPSDYEGSYLTIHGTVAERADNVGGGSNVIVEDVTGRTTVRIWNSTNALYNSLGVLQNEELDTLLTVGNMVEISGVVSLYNGEAQILLGYAEDAKAYIPGEPGSECTKLTVAPYPFVPKLGEVIKYTYEYPSNCRVILRVYDMSGRFITTLEDNYFALSWKKDNTWDGRNELNQLVSPGTYLFHLEATNRTTGKTQTDIAPVVIGVKF